jgi:ABC-type sulfate transport system substrate-binding protein
MPPGTLHSTSNVKKGIPQPHTITNASYQMLAAQAATKKQLQLKDAHPPTDFTGVSHNNSNSQQ